jgi:glycosyltransferase involved in cell wall biosynthesis
MNGVAGTRPPGEPTEVRGQEATGAGIVRPRILMGVPAAAATGGGPALHLPMLVADLRELGFEVQTFPYGRWAEGESPYQKIFRQAVDWLRFPRRLRRAQADLLHLNSALDKRALLRDVPFVLLARWMRQRVVVKWHGAETDLLTQGGLWGTACRLLLQRLQTLCVLSEHERQAVQSAGFTLPCVVVRNGLDLQRYHERRDVHARLGIEPGTPLLLFIARLIATKGLRDTLEAFREVAASTAAHLVVIGDGPEKSPAEALCGEWGLTSRVHFLGRLTEAEALDYYCGCDILVFPTFHAEGFPMSIFQAVASGMGVVTTRIRAAADHLTEAENALFVPPHEPTAVAEALRRLLREEGLLQHMRQANRSLAHRFDRRVVAAQFAEIYGNAATPADPNRKSPVA